MSNILKDLSGFRFNRLVVLNRDTTKKGKNTYWNCVCDCGNIISAQSSNLKVGNVTSCGCYRKEFVSKTKTTHGQSTNNRTKTYAAWCGMLQRCKDLTNKNYGGRGIIVCDRWLHSFENFLLDMGEAPLNTSIDRINVNGNYEPNNCRWATKTEQDNNRRTCIYVEYQGRKQTIIEWERELGFKSTTLRVRIKAGWSIEKAMTTPVRK